ncbi:MAG: hypothetical protein ACRDSL_25715 [Pseudonocardiaceae bacterium]
MSRGPGVVQRFILDYLAAGHPEPDGRGSMLGRYRPVGHPLGKIAAACTGTEFVDRCTMCSFGRAMAALRRAGLIEVRHRYKHPYLRLAARQTTRKGAK